MERQLYLHIWLHIQKTITVFILGEEEKLNSTEMLNIAKLKFSCRHYGGESREQISDATKKTIIINCNTIFDKTSYVYVLN